MEQVVITVEALRCHQCRQVMHPSEQFFRDQVMTSVSVSRYADTTNTYALVDVCPGCHADLVRLEKEEQLRAWWRRLWTWGIVAYVALNVFVPLGPYPLCVVIGIRCWWKRQAKRRQQRAPGQTAQRVLRATAPSAAAELPKSDPSS
jgi:hypothetical protein